ncbi:MAG: TIGR01777 family oxidoreductase [Micromonosporaceae bacterium]
MKVVVSGASGFLGGHLVTRLREEGRDVVRLVRRPARTDDEVQWQPARRELDPAVLDGVDAVVNLSGAAVGARRWTARYKREILDSRVDSTATLAAALAAAGSRSRVLLSASGIDWYGESGEHAVDESAPKQDGGYLTTVTHAWEAATDPAREAGVRVVTLRTGLVLAASGGLLVPMLPLFRWGLGGRLGSGRQFMSWISLQDWLGAVVFLLDQEISGPVNLTAPHPETNTDFTRALGSALHRPTLLPVPRFALRIGIGEFADSAVGSLRVLPGVLTRAGYGFAHPELRPALDWALAH